MEAVNLPRDSTLLSNANQFPIEQGELTLRAHVIAVGKFIWGELFGANCKTRQIILM
jgi:hypothetical protein